MQRSDATPDLGYDHVVAWLRFRLMCRMQRKAALDWCKGIETKS
jgi:hypothetical protein